MPNFYELNGYVVIPSPIDGGKFIKLNTATTNHLLDIWKKTEDIKKVDAEAEKIALSLAQMDDEGKFIPEGYNIDEEKEEIQVKLRKDVTDDFKNLRDEASKKKDKDKDKKDKDKKDKEKKDKEKKDKKEKDIKDKKDKKDKEKKDKKEKDDKRSSLYKKYAEELGVSEKGLKDNVEKLVEEQSNMEKEKNKEKLYVPEFEKSIISLESAIRNTDIDKSLDMMASIVEIASKKYDGNKKLARNIESGVSDLLYRIDNMKEEKEEDKDKEKEKGKFTEDEVAKFDDIWEDTKEVLESIDIKSAVELMNPAIEKLFSGEEISLSDKVDQLEKAAANYNPTTDVAKAPSAIPGPTEKAHEKSPLKQTKPDLAHEKATTKQVKPELAFTEKEPAGTKASKVDKLVSAMIIKGLLDKANEDREKERFMNTDDIKKLNDLASMVVNYDSNISAIVEDGKFVNLTELFS